MAGSIPTSEGATASGVTDVSLILQGVRSSAVPRPTSGHALVRGQFFYTLPAALLGHVEEAVGRDRFDEALWRMEHELSMLAKDHAVTVGFHDALPISYGYLRERTLDGDAIQYLREATAGNPSAVIHEVRERLHAANRNVRAYLGWLLTNPVFLEEHYRIWHSIAPLSAEGQMPQPVPAGALCEIGRMGFPEGTDRRERESLAELRNFCARWRLAELRGPLLPMPLAIQFPAMNPVFAVQFAVASGYGMVSVPDTMPLPSENELRAMTAAAIHGQEAGHLKEWFAVVGARNPARRPLPRYARLFELQHYVRLLLSRHGDAFFRRLMHLHSALASFLEVDDQSVRRDMSFIARRLGEQWWRRFPVPTLT